MSDAEYKGHELLVTCHASAAPPLDWHDWMARAHDANRQGRRSADDVLQVFPPSTYIDSVTPRHLCSILLYTLRIVSISMMLCCE